MARGSAYLVAQSKRQHQHCAYRADAHAHRAEHYNKQTRNNADPGATVTASNTATALASPRGPPVQLHPALPPTAAPATTPRSNASTARASHDIPRLRQPNAQPEGEVWGLIGARAPTTPPGPADTPDQLIDLTGDHDPTSIPSHGRDGTHRLTARAALQAHARGYAA